MRFSVAPQSDPNAPKPVGPQIQPAVGVPLQVRLYACIPVLPSIRLLQENHMYIRTYIYACVSEIIKEITTLILLLLLRSSNCLLLPLYAYFIRKYFNDFSLLPFPFQNLPEWHRNMEAAIQHYSISKAKQPAISVIDANGKFASQLTYGNMQALTVSLRI